MIGKNVLTDFSTKVCVPVIDPTAYVHPLAAVIGNITLGKSVMVSPFAAVRGDEGQPLYVGDNSNVQDGVVIHALETEMNGQPVEKNLYSVGGKKYAVYVGSRVSLAHQVQIIHRVALLVAQRPFISLRISVVFAWLQSDRRATDQPVLAHLDETVEFAGEHQRR